MSKNINHQENDTIFAFATGNNLASVAIIRISGPKAIELAKKVTKSRLKRANVLSLANFYHKNKLIDKIMIVHFLAPHSYTGEDMLELHCHGSKPILEEICRILSEDYKIRSAKPGEFTKRAYLNNKMTLIEAESIADLIDAKYLLQAQNALQILEGTTPQYLTNLNNQLIAILAEIEARIDFVEDVSAANEKKIAQNISFITRELEKEVGSFSQLSLKDGINLGIFGKVNAGKSSLFNNLVNHEKAIVSAIPGTTRDILSDQIFIESYLVKLHDTAGFRELLDSNNQSDKLQEMDQDQIEKIGQKKAKELYQKLHLKIWLTQHTTCFDDLNQLIINKQNFDIFVLNKSDLISDKEVAKITIKLKEMIKKSNLEIEKLVVISAKDSKNIDLLKLELKKIIDKKYKATFSALPITRQRHKEELQEIISALKRASKSFDLSFDLVGQEIQSAVYASQRLLGNKADPEDFLDKIFNSFCIGK